MCINWSTRNLGTVHLTHIITKTSARVFESIQKTLQAGEFNKFGNGLCHPPKNAVALTAQTTNIFAYSLKKKSAYLVPEYSVTKPATSSDSDSGRSNGVLLVSAKVLIKNIF